MRPFFKSLTQPTNPSQSKNQMVLSLNSMKIFDRKKGWGLILRLLSENTTKITLTKLIPVIVLVQIPREKH